jgi:hypothetical protein
VAGFGAILFDEEFFATARFEWLPLTSPFDAIMLSVRILCDANFESLIVRLGGGKYSKGGHDSSFKWAEGIYEGYYGVG